VRDADDVDFGVDDVHSALTLAFDSFNSVIILSDHHARHSHTDAIDEQRNGHSRSLKVICCCANRQGIYNFRLALNTVKQY